MLLREKKGSEAAKDYNRLSLRKCDMPNSIQSAWLKLAIQMVLHGTQPLYNLLQKSKTEGADTSKDRSPSGELVSLYLDDLESFFGHLLADEGIAAEKLSKRKGRESIEPRKAPDVALDRPVYFICDSSPVNSINKPAHNGYLYVAVAIYTRPRKIELAEVLAAIIIDIPSRHIHFCDAQRAGSGTLTEAGEVEGMIELTSTAWEKVDIPEGIVYGHILDATQIMSKLRKICPTWSQYEPHTGPLGYCRIAEGNAQVYIAKRQPYC